MTLDLVGAERRFESFERLLEEIRREVREPDGVDRAPVVEVVECRERRLGVVRPDGPVDGQEVQGVDAEAVARSITSSYARFREWILVATVTE
jgi:hypothetical protein